MCHSKEKRQIFSVPSDHKDLSSRTRAGRRSNAQSATSMLDESSVVVQDGVATLLPFRPRNSEYRVVRCQLLQQLLTINAAAANAQEWRGNYSKMAWRGSRRRAVAEAAFASRRREKRQLATRRLWTVTMCCVHARGPSRPRQLLRAPQCKMTLGVARAMTACLDTMTPQARRMRQQTTIFSQRLWLLRCV